MSHVSHWKMCRWNVHFAQSSLIEFLEQSSMPCRCCHCCPSTPETFLGVARVASRRASAQHAGQAAGGGDDQEKRVCRGAAETSLSPHTVWKKCLSGYGTRITKNRVRICVKVRKTRSQSKRMNQRATREQWQHPFRTTQVSASATKTHVENNRR